MLEIIGEEIAKIVEEYWQAVTVVLGFCAVSYLLLFITGSTVTFAGMGNTVFTIFVVVGLLAIGFLVERVYRRMRSRS